ncbi:hypothetical protein KC343_g1200 [Hortaea werneckii]|uniref:Ubiquitin-like-conjugating enzyme ATG10 n=1 Tax=Hortaea werneckii TaxID=91943 RepID=A0A3M7H630_HORWE|nr:hypothetical protein KC352_g5667 [Hortaea werneckii]KAI7572719.1 hypothetical protein KC317_g498 [Hortaea werneckii]KAI7627961.1 hypothetical protein KC346_g455 [Hortaea werneckii]KAI7636588.1 hypothetical protein KC343_g1200 [Hortaea werneckii]KAI7672359.1 hypothetical protein KC319_g5335 [Hortaea werneckii]
MSLTPTEFAEGVQTLASAWCDVVPADQGDWQDVRALGKSGVHRLRISRLVRPHPFAVPRDEQNMSCGTTSPDGETVSNGEAEEPLPQLEEEDLESLTKSAPSRTGVETEREVHYDIVYSPTYQVPVLYLSFPSTGRSPLPSPDEVYNLLVPFTYRAQLQAVGPMSALSMTGEHPVTGGPAYFVHPCLTQDSMRAVMAGREVSAAEYLVMWIGVVGATVGLSLPVSLARKLQSSDRTM